MKINLLVFVLAIFSLCAVQFCDSILVGEDVVAGEFSYVVSIRNESSNHYCNGALISTRHVVTAAHCLYTDKAVFDVVLDERYDPANLNVVVNSIYSEFQRGMFSQIPGAFYNVSNLTPHPNFDIKDLKLTFYDIGIITLSQTVDIKGVFPVNLPMKPINYETTATIVGWGLQRKNNKRFDVSTTLQKAKLEIMIPEYCVSIYNVKENKLPIFNPYAVVFRKVLCGSSENSNTCYRDSGSPLVQDGMIIGVAILGNECEFDSPALFTRVYENLGFIRNIIEERCIEEKKYDGEDVN